jgi:hypothetical protein
VNIKLLSYQRVYGDKVPFCLINATVISSDESSRDYLSFFARLPLAPDLTEKHFRDLHFRGEKRHVFISTLRASAKIIERDEMMSDLTPSQECE